MSEHHSHRIDASFTVAAASRTDAAAHLARTVHVIIGASEPHDSGGAQVTGWQMDPESALPGWESFEGSGVPEIVAEMFPPEPDREAFRTPTGEIDEDAFEEAHAPWREECLTLAVQAARLPDVLARLDRAERARDAIIDVLDRHPLPNKPHRTVLPAHVFGFSVDEDAYAADVARWQAQAAEAATARDRALRTVLQDGGNRTMFLPARFQQEWVPRDLFAVTALRALLDAEPAVTGRILDRDTRQHLEAMLHADDPDIRIMDPDDPDGVELYDGPASEAHRWIPPGVYDATGPDGHGTFRVVVGRAPMSAEGTASWAFPPAEHDSSILSQIAATLDRAADSEHGVSADAVLGQVQAFIIRSGRTEPPPEAEATQLEQGVLLSDLLAERDRQLGHPAPGQTPEARPDDPDLTR